MAIVTLVVVEHGGSEPPKIGTSENTIIGYSSRGLLRRTRRRLDSLRSQGDVVRVAEIVCSDTTEGSLVAHRAEMAHELLTAVAFQPGGRLLLSASGTASMALRSGMFSLAGVLSARLPGTVATVSVRFGTPYDRAVSRGPARVVSMPFPWRDRDLPQSKVLVRPSLPMESL
jgi:hypothetical protein